MVKVNEIGMKIKFYRKKIGWSQKLLGNRLGYLDPVAKQMIYNWETGRRIPTIENLNQLSLYLNCSIKELIDNGKISIY